MIIIDATNLIVGRFAGFVAKKALLGNQIVIINSEKAVISGDRDGLFDEYLHRRERGAPMSGPFIHRMPNRLLRRNIRGMLPHHKAKGKDAYKRIMCYVGVPEEFKDKKAITIESANVAKLPTLKYVNLLTISKRLGAKV
jgi:large subunit ribosomal protein L13